MDLKMYTFQSSSDKNFPLVLSSVMAYILPFIHFFINLISHLTNIVPTIGGIKPRKMTVGCATTVCKNGKVR